MKPNVLLFALVGFLFLSALCTVVLATRHFFAMVELQRLQAQAAMVNNTLNSAQALANEAILYSRRNPAITSVLLRFKAAGPATNTLPSPGNIMPPTQLMP